MDIMVVFSLMRHKPTNIFLLSFMQEIEKPFRLHISMEVLGIIKHPSYNIQSCKYTYHNGICINSRKGVEISARFKLGVSPLGI